MLPTLFWKLAPPASIVIRRCRPPGFKISFARFICDNALLRMDLYDAERQRFSMRIKDMDSFWLRVLTMKDNNLILEEDLKMAWYLADKEYLASIIELTDKFQKDSKARFSTFQFGPLIMRSCHFLKTPDVAFEIFNQAHFARIMDNPITVIILMDLLIETGNLEKAISVYEKVLVMEWFFILRHPIVPMLYAKSLYLQGTKEGLSKATLFCKRLLVALAYKNKIIEIVAAHALKVNEPKIAISLMSNKALDSELAWNIKVQGHVMESDWDKVFREIKYRKQHSLYEDTLQLIQESGMKNISNLGLKPMKTTVQEKVTATITLEENKEIMMPTKKKYYM